MKAAPTLALVLTIPACSDRAGTGSADGGSSSATGDATDTSGGAVVDEVPECGVVESCGVVSSPSSCNQPDGCGWTDYLDEHRCALMLLASGEVGQIDYSDGCEGMCYGELVLVRGDGLRSAVRQGYYDDIDLGRVFTGARECTLADAAYFESCLAAYDDACLGLSSWFATCADVASFQCTAMQ